MSIPKHWTVTALGLKCVDAILSWVWSVRKSLHHMHWRYIALSNCCYCLCNLNLIRQLYLSPCCMFLTDFWASLQAFNQEVFLTSLTLLQSFSMLFLQYRSMICILLSISLCWQSGNLWLFCIFDTFFRLTHLWITSDASKKIRELFYTLVDIVSTCSFGQ